MNINEFNNAEEAELLGYRVWAIEGNKLYPVLSPVQQAWDRTHSAHCMLLSGIEAAHSAPAENCSCGIHAFHYLEDALRYLNILGENSSRQNYALGLIRAKGKVISSKLSWRAQSAEIVAVLGNDCLQEAVSLIFKNKKTQNIYKTFKTDEILNLDSRIYPVINDKKELNKLNLKKPGFSFLRSRDKQENQFLFSAYKINEFNVEFLNQSSAEQQLYREAEERFLAKNTFKQFSSNSDSGKKQNYAALGYRCWKEMDGSLYPVIKSRRGRPLVKGENLAECDPSDFLTKFFGGDDAFKPCEGPPSKKHHCGFNAFHSLESAVESSYNSPLRSTVIGSVAGWGKMRIHLHGWRAEKMQLIALYQQSPTGFIIDNDYLNYLNIARKYSVPVFTSSELLEFYSKKHSAQVPKELIPKEAMVDEHVRATVKAATDLKQKRIYESKKARYFPFVPSKNPKERAKDIQDLYNRIEQVDKEIKKLRKEIRALKKKARSR